MLASQSWKALRKLFLVALLMIGLVTLVHGFQGVAHASCCTCDADYAACLDECAAEGWPSACSSDCLRGYNRCVAHCPC